MSETGSNPQKPTEEWVTGDEPMTGPQESYLHTLARETGREIPEGLTKAQASELIEELQRQRELRDSPGDDPDAPGLSVLQRGDGDAVEPNEPA